MDGFSSAPWVPMGITKSNSNCSSGGRSTKSTGGRSTKSTGVRPAKSYESIRVIGRFVLGTLRLISHDPPEPLPYPVGQSQPVQRGPATVPWNRLTHNMGRGDVVIVLGLPDAYAVGYNNIPYVAMKFTGVKQLPAGPHFFWASHSGNLASRCGFWIMSTGINRVHVVQWNEDSEAFVQPTRAETRIQAEGVDKIYDELPRYRDASAVGPSPEQYNPARAAANKEMWEQLTGSISESALDRIAADQEGGWNTHTCDSVKGAIRLPSEMFRERGYSHALFQCHELKFCFEQQTKTFAAACVGPDRPPDARDSTSYILARVKDPNNPSDRALAEEDIVGEFQFLYIQSMYLGSDACIQQWWFTVLSVIFKAYRLALRRPRLTAGFLRTITAQIIHTTAWIDNSIIANNVSKARDLRLALVVYRRRLHELFKGQDKETITPDHLAVQAAFSRLETVVKSELRWDLKNSFLRRNRPRAEDRQRLGLDLGEPDEDEERGDWEPSAGELDDQGRELGLVSWRN